MRHRRRELPPELERQRKEVVLLEPRVENLELWFQWMLEPRR